jgi:hypothetical protein
MKRILCLIFAIILCFSSFIVPVSADEVPIEEDDTIYILAIGNSYSNNASYYVSSIAYGLGKKVSVVSLYDDGCTLERHVKWYKQNAEEYEFYIDGVNYSKTKKNTMKEAFALYDYDYVTIQQGSGPATTFSTYEPYLTELNGIIKKHLPNAKILIHQTWSYSEHGALGNGPYWTVAYKSSLDMFGKIENAYKQAANKIGLNPEKDIIPVGKAIQLAKDEYGFGDFYIEGELSAYDKCADGALYNDNVNHLNMRGRYIAGCVWVEKILGLDCRETTCAESGMFSDEETMVMRQIAHEVVTGEVQCVVGDWRVVPYERVDNDTFEKEKGVKLIHVMGEAPADGTVIIPADFDGQKVLMVDETAFKYVDGIKKVIIPANIEFEEKAFKGIEKEVVSVKKGNDNISEEKGNADSSLTLIIIAVIAVIIVIMTMLMSKHGKALFRLRIL